MSKYEIISREYYSNCLIEVIKAKIKNPSIKIYFCKPKFEHGKFQMFHFMWSDGKADYDFSDIGIDPLPLHRMLLFKGAIRKFKRGFAKRYSVRQNSK